MGKELTPRTVLITGGSRGIGAAAAWLCAQQGWAVAVNYANDAKAAHGVVERIRSAGGTALALQADVADEAQVLAMFETLDRELPPLGALVNNAGVVDLPSRVDAMSLQRLQRMFAINVFGTFICSREAVKRMSTRHGGAGGGISASMAANIASTCASSATSACSAIAVPPSARIFATMPCAAAASLV